jgi:hypothetical protein
LGRKESACNTVGGWLAHKKPGFQVLPPTH